ncbi:protein FAM83A [Ambystoma mexicanum]|uniref:protein FAM83A n=1 Tax=Ambystoma mexicanum TaxID=8296 RepID=UPI0037E8698C
MNRSKHFGKIRKRLEEAKNQWSRLSKVDFSHNESARLATDALLDGGEEAYRRALQEEGEVDFLSAPEAAFITGHAREPCCGEGPEGDPRSGADSRSVQSGTCYPMNYSEPGSEPELLHHWGADEKPYLKDKSSATVYFQGDKANSLREIIRRCIHRTTQALAIIMDEFTDAEIFCDVLEAANKRNVVVYLLLDLSNIKLFTDMCEKLQVRDIHLKNICIRSLAGEVYCAKSGKKFSGRIQEKFIISDWRCVLTGSYSFTWLSGQVHRNILSKFCGHAVELFDVEFRYLYGVSKPVMGLKPPVPRVPVLLRETTAAKSSVTNSSTPESANTTSEPLSGSSTHSVSQTHEPPRSPVYNSPIVNSPLQRVNSFHGYTITSPATSNGMQTTYYQRNFMTNSPTSFFNNGSIYRPVRNRQEDNCNSRFTHNWRVFSRPTVT